MSLNECDEPETSDYETESDTTENETSDCESDFDRPYEGLDYSRLQTLENLQEPSDDEEQVEEVILDDYDIISSIMYQCENTSLVDMLFDEYAEDYMSSEDFEETSELNKNSKIYGINYFCIFTERHIYEDGYDITNEVKEIKSFFTQKYFNIYLKTLINYDEDDIMTFEDYAIYVKNTYGVYFMHYEYK